MGQQRIQGNRSVQIQGVVGSRIEITYDGTTRTVPLEPAHVPVAAKLPSPARLVRAHSGVVPYVERAGLLAELSAWIDSPAPFAGQVVGGRGGTGKTRLAVELCLATQKSGWLCGFLSRIADPGMLDALVEAPTARLIVIDYAETRPEQVELLLPLLNAKATPESPVRVLLLVRDSPDSVGDWASRLADRVDGLDAVLDECEICYLEDAPFGVAERRKLFQDAVPALAGHLRGPPVSAAAPDLEDEVFENPLMVVIAAYLAAHGEEAPTTREGLLDEVLAHERRYWREGSAGIDVDDALLERMVALATLVKADSEAQAAERLRLLSDLRDAPAERRNRLARWVRAQYPGPHWWGPLEPDLLGEHLVARCFNEQPEVLGGAIAAGEPEEITRPLEVLARAAADRPDLAEVLRPIFSTELVGLCEVAVAQAAGAQDGDLIYGNAVTVAAAIDGAASVVRVNAEALSAAVGLMPPRADLMLNELAATLTAQWVEIQRSLVKDSPTDFASDLASALNTLSVRLSDAGRRAEALQAIEEAVEIYRSLVKDDLAAYAPGSAMALNNLSSRLSEAGRRVEGLEACEEAVETYRALAKADPGTYAPDLAMALNNLSVHLSDAGRLDEALEAIEEAVEIYRALAKADPATYMPDLAMALNNLCNRLAHAGRRDEALEASEEAVEIYRALAKAGPAAYTPDLASALNNLSNRLSEAGRRVEGLEVSEEAVETYRSLTRASPAAHAPNLASALNNLSIRLAHVDRQDEALEASEEAAETYRVLSRASPAAYTPSLARALNSLSNRLAEAGRPDEALKASEEAVAIRRPLAEASPAAYMPDLAMGLNNLSNRLAEAGRPDEALKASEEAVAIRRSLVGANPAAYASSLASALNNLSIRLAEAGREDEALKAIDEAVETYRALAETAPAAYAPDLARALNNLADRLAVTGRDEEAENARREATELLP